ncbi:hypothetical protein N7454_010789 [Penicillium verhagenii]|nr:hypothetical protein N7454_010789 [Penicillium verhagenii]
MSTINPANMHDWSATQYLKFKDERTLPARDLLARVPLQAPKRVVDLGCGPGNSTAVLEDGFIPRHDQKAKSTLPHLTFNIEDLNTYTPEVPVDLYYSNAVFQWIERADRIRILKNLIKTQPPGGVFAFQVPDNLDEPSHVSMGETAEAGPWATKLQSVGRDTFQSPQEIYDQLKPLCSEVNLFHTSYYHSLENHSAIIEWVKGTGLRPYVDPLEPEEKEAFLEEYLRRLENAYPVSADGRVLLRYPRLFVVTVKS